VSPIKAKYSYGNGWSVTNLEDETGMDHPDAINRFIFGYLILNILLLIILPKVYSQAQKDILDLSVATIMIACVVFSMISIWDCSKNTKKTVW